MKKKRVLLIGALLTTALLNAQEATSSDSGEDVPRTKKGHEILPKQGDIALGFNTIPVLDVILGTLNRATPFAGAGNAVQYTSNSNNQIAGKYFLDAKTAIRARFGVNTISGSVTNRVQDAEIMYKATLGTLDDIAKASLVKVEDKVSFSKSNVMISVGLEKRRGYQRLQGFYGAELGFGTYGSKQSMTYGNQFSDQYEVEYTTNFNSLTTAYQNPIGFGRTAERITEAKNTGGLIVGLRGFIGIEYFIFPKISIAAEYNWGYALQTRSKATYTREVYNNGQKRGVLIENVDEGSSQSTKGFSVGNNNGGFFSMNNTLNGNTALSGGAGALTLLFHF